MNRKTILRIAQGNAAMAVFIMLLACIYLAQQGFRRANIGFHRAEAVSIIFAIAAVICGVKYTSAEWNGRPDKQQKLRTLKWLAAFIVIAGIVAVFLDWQFV